MKRTDARLHHSVLVLVFVAIGLVLFFLLAAPAPACREAATMLLLAP